MLVTWCRVQRRVVPGDVTKTLMLPLFSGLTLFLTLRFTWRPWRGLRPTWLCKSFSGLVKPGSQSLTHIRSVRTIEVTLERSASWQVDLHRQHHQVVIGDEEEAAVQWGTKVEMAVR